MTTGKYIVIEGHDGTGKSTQVKQLRIALEEQGIKSVEFHEPEGTPIADAIRTVIKNGALSRDGTTNLLLFSAARHELWYTVALPALRRGEWVITSRNYFSTLAYQGYGEGLDLELIESVTRQATDERYMRPDIAVVLDLEDERERERRINARGHLENTDTFESRDTDFQSNVHAGYKSVANTYNLPLIDATQSIEDVTADIWKIVNLRSDRT